MDDIQGWVKLHWSPSKSIFIFYPQNLQNSSHFNSNMNAYMFLCAYGDEHWSNLNIKIRICLSSYYMWVQENKIPYYIYVRTKSGLTQANLRPKKFFFYFFYFFFIFFYFYNGLYTHTHTNIYIYIYIYVYICMYIYVYICVCVCVRARTCIT